MLELVKFKVRWSEKVIFMKKRIPLSMAGKLTVAGLVIAAAGILIQYFSGVEGFPTIPPGPVILLVAAAVVAFGPWRWAIIVGVATALFVLVGGTIATIANWGGRAPL